MRRIPRSKGKLTRAGSDLTEEEVALATSREDKLLLAEIIWLWDAGALCKSSLASPDTRSTYKESGENNLYMERHSQNYRR